MAYDTRLTTPLLKQKPEDQLIVSLHGAISTSGLFSTVR